MPFHKGTVSLYKQFAVQNLASGSVVNCEYLRLSVGCHNQI